MTTNENDFPRLIKNKDDEQEGETPEPPKEQEYSFIEVRVSIFSESQ
jgi:hypothetical protein